VQAFSLTASKTHGVTTIRKGLPDTPAKKKYVFHGIRRIWRKSALERVNRIYFSLFTPNRLPSAPLSS
jgi:hypothetical protein